jgi:peptidoglycan/LPS O-acetylase OafA/YrhL
MSPVGVAAGGFVGVDVFFVISGFLITANLLRMAETTGTVSFATFYWNRIRRIVPAATVVLILIYAASTLVFLPFRSHQVGVDALFAFGFASNWWFAYQNTDYFRASDDPCHRSSTTGRCPSKNSSTSSGPH